MEKPIPRRSRQSVGALSPQDVAKSRWEVEQMVARIASQDPYKHHRAHAKSWSQTMATIVRSSAKRLVQFQQLLQDDEVIERGLPTESKRRSTLLLKLAHGLLMPLIMYWPFETSLHCPQMVNSTFTRC